MLEIRNFSKSYGKHVAVDHISFTIYDGEVCVLLGPNGAGKSTTIQSLVGLLRYEGSITLDGVTTKEQSSKARIAYVAELPALFKTLTVREHLEYMTKAYGMRVDELKIDTLLKRFDLYDKQDKYGDELSKGMMQKVSICCALVVNPDVLILDEPMVGLDPKAIRELKNVILEYKNQGKTLIISTHMLDMVDMLWDRVILMERGKIVGDYTKSMMEGIDLEAIYFELTQSQDQDLENE